MSLVIGSKVKGKVTGISKFGAFVTLPGGEVGLVHISEVANKYVENINEHLKIGDEVEVKILDIKENKISLSIKQTQEKPREDKGFKKDFKKDFKKGPKNFSKDRKGKGSDHSKESFEDKLSRFLKSSEESLSSLKKSTESKRGGRGGRRA